MEKSKKMIVQALICVGLLCAIWGGYFVANKKIEQSIEKIMPDDFSWVVQVDEVKSEGGKFVLEGFAFKLNQEAEENAYDIVLRNLETGEFLFPKMQYTERQDVNDYFLCEYDYTRSGFVATLKDNRLDFDSQDYEVLLKPKNGKSVYQISTYISERELQFVEPSKCVSLEMAGTELEEVVNQGKILVCDLDNHMYVYQFQDELYWIAEEDYGFVDGDTYVQYQPSTTQKNKLPEHRIKSNVSFDNIGFMFSQYEMSIPEVEGYRITKRALPKAYSITKILTGNYIDKEWIWNRYFRPWYKFE